MNIEFPLPSSARRLHIILTNACWEKIDYLVKEKGIPDRMIISTLIQEAIREFFTTQYNYVSMDKKEPDKFIEDQESEDVTCPYYKCKLKGYAPVNKELNGKMYHTDCAEKEKHRIYSRKWWEKNKRKKVTEKEAEQIIYPSADGKKNLITFKLTEKQQKNANKEDEHLKDICIPCPNINCNRTVYGKFVQGTGYIYKEKEYCSEECVRDLLAEEDKI